jgi:hypothetical protein
VPITSAQLEAFEARPIGPAVTGGRVTDLAGIPDRPSVLYVATASGGLWKTTNRGHSWTPLFDDMPVSTFGDVALAPSDPDIVYAGTGEQNNRQSASWGDGVYRSDDGGGTWRHLGLVETRHIGKIEIHPEDPDVVWVAALGNLWKANPERGVFKTTDGGETWEKVLFVDDETGAVDLVMNPRNPDVLYAATYQRMRRTWGFNGGGPGSGIWKSEDGGESWTELTRGLPDGDEGRIGLAISESSPDVVMATVETGDDETQGTYRSEDAGATWERVNELNPRPMYYSEIFIDPTTDQRVYVLGTTSYKSEDGGRSFEVIAERPSYDVGVHADHHAFWIDRTDPDHVWLAGDAGLHESYDRGTTFRKVNNFPIGQFYAIGVDMRDPYWVYGGMQDNHSWMAPNETRRWIGVVDDDWQQIGYGDGMFWSVDPTDPRYAYGASNDGSYSRLDTETGDMLDIAPPAPEGDEYRFDWTSPLMVSRHDPSTVYVAGNRFFISRDRGETWERSPDLSKQVDRDTVRIMGVLGADMTISPNDGTGSYGEAVTLDESPVDPDVLWVGMDDGNLQVSRDGGGTWTDVSGNVPGLPAGTYPSRIHASTAGPGVAWATFDAHRDGDFSPYVYHTEDYGRTWESRHRGLPTGSVNALTEHPDNPDVVFLGTEHAAFVSTDAGATWAKLPGVPTTAYDDIVVHPREKDLVLGTHGRSIWIVDDTRPLAAWTADAVAGPAHLFEIAPGTLFHYWKDTSYRGNAEWHGVNPPDGVYVTYRLGAGGGNATLRVTDAAGATVREMRVPSGQGVHRVTWDLRHGMDNDQVETWQPWDDPGLPRPTDFRGPFVSPGSYTVTLDARGQTLSQPVEVRGDPELDLTATQYRDRERFLLDALALMGEIEEATAAVRRAQRDATGERAETLEQAGQRLRRAGFMVRGAYGSLNGGGVRQGSLFPPTESQTVPVEQARRILAEVRSAAGL